MTSTMIRNAVPILIASLLFLPTQGGAQTAGTDPAVGDPDIVQLPPVVVAAESRTGFMQPDVQRSFGRVMDSMETPIMS